MDGTSTSITGLKYDDSNVVLTLSPHVSLSGQKVEFIELDGSVGLSLEVSVATEDSSAGTLTWSVSDQPWGDGDELMLRISTSTSLPPTPTPEPTYATPEPAATPTPPQASSVTVTLTPRVQTSLTFTDRHHYCVDGCRPVQQQVPGECEHQWRIPDQASGLPRCPGDHSQ